MCGDCRGEYHLVLPEPPSINRMIELSKKRRTVFMPGGRKKSLPIVYSEAKATYGSQCTLVTRQARIFPPRHPWEQWRIVGAEIRRHQLLDHVEAMSCLKWPVDWLKQAGFVVDDSPRHLMDVPLPIQRVARKDRGVTLVIARIDL